MLYLSPSSFSMSTPFFHTNNDPVITEPVWLWNDAERCFFWLLNLTRRPFHLKSDKKICLIICSPNPVCWSYLLTILTISQMSKHIMSICSFPHNRWRFIICKRRQNRNEQHGQCVHVYCFYCMISEQGRWNDMNQEKKEKGKIFNKSLPLITPDFHLVTFSSLKINTTFRGKSRRYISL